MCNRMRMLIARYGSQMKLLHDGETYTVRAFLQDTHAKSQENVQREFSPLGEIPKGRFVYLGPVEPAAVAGDVLTWQGRQFLLRRAEPVLVGDTAVYRWGLCVEKGGEYPWES